MNTFIQSIIDKKYDVSKNILEETLNSIIERKMYEMKKQIAAKMCEEEQELDEGRINIVRIRIRGGKVQRRKKVSNVSGMTIRSGRLTRMSVAERRKRRLGAKRAKLKRRSKMAIALRRRKLSLMKRKRLGA